MKREELYTLVWSAPMRTVAKRIGVSDVALAKRCRRMAIPLPGRGYWAKRAAGKKVKQISLPRAIPGKTIESFEIGLRREVSIEPAAAQPHEGPVWEQKQFEALPELSASGSALTKSKATLARVLIWRILNTQEYKVLHARKSPAPRRSSSSEVASRCARSHFVFQGSRRRRSE